MRRGTYARSIAAVWPDPDGVSVGKVSRRKRSVTRLANDQSPAVLGMVISADGSLVYDARRGAFFDDDVNRPRLRPVFGNVIPLNAAVFTFVSLQRNHIFTCKRCERETSANKEESRYTGKEPGCFHHR
jgi:hypothetical protein